MIKTGQWRGKIRPNRRGREHRAALKSAFRAQECQNSVEIKMAGSRAAQSAGRRVTHAHTYKALIDT